MANVIDNNVFINMVLETVNNYVSDEDLLKIRNSMNEIMQNYSVIQNKYAVSNPDEIPQAYKAFFVAKKIEGLSDATIKDYRIKMDAFFSEVKIPIENITPQTIQVYLFKKGTTANENGEMPKAQTIRQIKSVLSAFFSWCKSNGYIDKNPCESIGRIKCQKKEIDVLTKEQIEKLRNASETFTDRTEQARAKAMVEILISTGMRVSEAINVRICDIDFNTNVYGLVPVKVVAGKGNKDRTVFLTTKAVSAITEYMKVRNSDSEYLFVRTTNGNGQITVRTAQNIVSTLGKAIGVDSCHPHMLRHSVATEMASEGIPINLVQKMLGHSSSATTTEYYIKAESKQLAKQISEKLN